MGGSCGSCRPRRPDMGVLVGLVCTDPLRGCALRDKKGGRQSDENQLRAPSDGGCGAWPWCTHITVWGWRRLLYFWISWVHLWGVISKSKYNKWMRNFQSCLRSVKPSSYLKTKAHNNDVWHMAWEWGETLTVGNWAATKDAWCEPHVRSPRQAAKREEFNAETADLCDHAFRVSPKGCNSKKENQQKNKGQENGKLGKLHWLMLVMKSKEKCWPIAAILTQAYKQCVPN